ncbi:MULTISPECIES: 3'-5' exonuclease [Bacillus subtilis group]|uniref:3'-5' exonuclease n=1 Tax=Bacillus subtilis group TaxID=653685 RepID=UPI00164CA52C|nr:MULTISPECIES: 3'-5' exonuclease [Bacillus subtilis group]UAY71969.1 3'-5' exonuclease [Bacillus paralicheniformis]
MYTVLDFETTGLNPMTEQVTEIGAVKLDAHFNEVGRMNVIVKLRKGQRLTDYIKELTGLTEEKLANGLDEQYALQALTSFIGKDIIIAQFASFDLSFLPFSNSNDFICTKSMFKLLYPEKKSGLKQIVAHYGIDYKNHHQAMADVEMTVQAFLSLKGECDARGISYINVMTEPEDRPLNFVPTKAVVIKGAN